MLPELQLAGDMRRLPIRCDLGHLPERRVSQHSMNGDGILSDPHGAQIGVECVLLVVSPETAAGHAVAPWRQKRNSVQSPSAAALESAYVARKIENVLAMHLHLVGAIAHRWNDRNLHPPGSVHEANNFHAVIGGLDGGVVSSGMGQEGQQ